MNVGHHNYDSCLKDGAMHSVKATLILSLTTLILLASYIAYNSHQDRFALLPIQADKSIYVFDRKNNTLNHCTSDNQCKLIKLNLPTEQVSKDSILPASLHNMLDGKNNKGKVEASTEKKPPVQKGTATVAAAKAPPAPAAQAKKTALIAAEVRTPALPVPAMPTPMPVSAMRKTMPEAKVATEPMPAAPVPPATPDLADAPAPDAPRAAAP
ncbi:MAG: hypothetical protein NWR39_00555 [Pseudomonadota bacterium]|nr:hypothetical protein [Pseudomonadota bacterium]